MAAATGSFEAVVLSSRLGVGGAGFVAILGGGGGGRGAAVACSTDAGLLAHTDTGRGAGGAALVFSAFLAALSPPSAAADGADDAAPLDVAADGSAGASAGAADAPPSDERAAAVPVGALSAAPLRGCCPLSDSGLLRVAEMLDDSTGAAELALAPAELSAGPPVLGDEAAAVRSAREGTSPALVGRATPLGDDGADGGRFARRMAA